MFVTNWILTTKIQKISEITNFFRHYFLSRTEVYFTILETFNKDTDDQIIIDRESHWKDVLFTRKFGYNKN